MLFFILFVLLLMPGDLERYLLDQTHDDSSEDKVSAWEVEIAFFAVEHNIELFLIVKVKHEREIINVDDVIRGSFVFDFV